ncbi:hypothetical protein GYMLUDRAFT_242325 [Collybiopsis luxurians FD-317 M1]|uniref:Peptidase C14 caspase domain-containing protein n=1 Tax=Collybiopsis luxurians FD-317 M1 TaxID=944289 RepID=A0A0D0CTD4_9AGAR|nr:hypothetical protein GYMLUDRAFT_242325 [Collybiopsis luxurians FD-317 M1]
MQEPTRGPDSSQQAASHFHDISALIIGISSYKHAPLLYGAANDAKAVEKFVKDKLGAKGPITMLLNEQATRFNIIHSLKSLAGKKDKKPILIFYAGHGGESTPPSGWEAGGPGQKVQNIIAWDSKFSDVQEEGQHDVVLANSRDNDYPIPDQTLGFLIDDIAQTRGDNITVIFDCCHSGSGAREGTVGEIRRVNVTRRLPSNLDSDIWKSLGREGKIPNGFRHKGVRSHVLLSACNQEQVAKEGLFDSMFYGRFTHTLLEALEKNLPILSNVTYRGLIKEIQGLDTQDNKQDPQCEGFKQNYFLFSDKLDLNRPKFPVRMQDGEIIMDSGAMFVTPGSEFNIYNKDELSLSQMSAKPLGVLVAKEVLTGITIMAYSGETFPIAAGAVAVQVYMASQKLYVSVSQDLHEIVSQAIQGMDQSRHSATIEEHGQVIITAESDNVTFKFADKRFDLACMRIPVSRTVKDIRSALQSAAHFMWYLNQESPSEPELDGKVTMHVRRGIEVIPRKEYKGTGENLDSVDRVVDINVDDNGMYVVEIFNESEHDLHVHLFLFNPSTLEIELLHAPPSSSRDVYPLLTRHGSLVLGTGAAGGPPLRFELIGKAIQDVSFLKLYASTYSGNELLSVKQDPLNKIISDNSRKGGNGKSREGKRDMLMPSDNGASEPKSASVHISKKLYPTFISLASLSKIPGNMTTSMNTNMNNLQQNCSGGQGSGSRRGWVIEGRVIEEAEEIEEGKEIG